MRVTLFDLDGTLLPLDSDHAFNAYVIGLGWADADEYRTRNDAFFADYQAGCLDIHDYIDFATAPWRNRPLSESRQARVGFIDSVMRPSIRQPALSLVRQHQDAGELVAIVTATNDFVTRPIADLFGIEHLIATDLARDAEGRATGAISGTPAYREGKVLRVSQWLAERGLRLEELEQSTFYSDSTNDLPLLAQVSHPVATNPSAALMAIAHSRGWPVLQLFNS